MLGQSLATLREDLGMGTQLGHSLLVLQGGRLAGAEGFFCVGTRLFMWMGGRFLPLFLFLSLLFFFLITHISASIQRFYEDLLCLLGKA